MPFMSHHPDVPHPVAYREGDLAEMHQAVLVAALVGSSDYLMRNFAPSTFYEAHSQQWQTRVNDLTEKRKLFVAEAINIADEVVSQLLQRG